MKRRGESSGEFGREYSRRAASSHLLLISRVYLFPKGISKVRVNERQLAGGGSRMKEGFFCTLYYSLAAAEGGIQ